MKPYIQTLGPPGSKRFELSKPKALVDGQIPMPSSGSNTCSHRFNAKSQSMPLAMTCPDYPLLKPLAMVLLAFVPAEASPSLHSNNAKRFRRNTKRIQRGRPPPGTLWPPGGNSSFSQQNTSGCLLRNLRCRMPIEQQRNATQGNTLPANRTQKYLCKST